MRNSVSIVFPEPKFSDTLSKERIKRRSLSIRNESKREINLFEMNPDTAACAKLKRDGIFLALCNPARSKQKKRVSTPQPEVLFVYPRPFYVLIIIKLHVALFGSL